MVTDFKSLDLTKKYSYADYLLWRFAERVELIKGLIYKMSPAPSERHQYISGNLYVELRRCVKKGKCRIYAAPFDVRLSATTTKDSEVYTVVQPDICVVCDLTKLDERGCMGAPNLIIEIVSPGNTRRELEDKYALYEENGVQEYWIVQPSDETISVFDLVGEKYALRKIYSNDCDISINVLDGAIINLKDVFS
jgi:Uma2 family endonuclease